MMVSLLVPFLGACLAHSASALAQVAPKAEALAVHEVDRRAALYDGGAAAEVDSRGEVGLLRRQTPSVITSVSNQTVYGNLVLLTVTPELFWKDAEVRSSARTGIEKVVAAANLTSGRVNVSMAFLENYVRAVRVEFRVAFAVPRHRQAFTSMVVTDGGRTLAASICKGVPSRFRAGCQLPGDGELQQDAGALPMSLVASDFYETESQKASGVVAAANLTCYGNISIMPQGTPEVAVQDQQWQEAVAMAMARRARVSRLQVGTLMAVVAKTVRVDFWLGKTACSKAAVASITNFDLSSSVSWEVTKLSVRGSEFPVFVRIMIQVPTPEVFTTNTLVLEAVEKAVAQVAAAPDVEARLSVVSTNVSLATVGNLSGVVRVGFAVAFRTPRDREVFNDDTASDMGEKLAVTINRQVGACEGRCRLPGQRQGKAIAPPSHDVLDERYGRINVYEQKALQLAGDPLVHEALAMAISQVTSVPLPQVGVLLTNEYYVLVHIQYWVASSNSTLRQAAFRRMQLAGDFKVRRCTLAHLDRLQGRVRSSGPTNAVAHGSVVLHVPDKRFAVDLAVRRALSHAIAQVAGVPSQVQSVRLLSDLSGESLLLVRVDFQVFAGTEARAENSTRALAADGGEKLVQSINELLPEPFKGLCRLPGQGRAKVATTATSTTRKPNSTLANKAANAASLPQRPHGTMLLYVYSPDSFIADRAEEAVATTIAEVASVPRSQVGIAMTVKSPVILSIDFWVMSTNATLRQVAVQRVNKKWTDDNLKVVWQRRNKTLTWPGYMVNGGTVFNAADRYSCHGL